MRQVQLSLRRIHFDSVYRAIAVPLCWVVAVSIGTQGGFAAQSPRFDDYPVTHLFRGEAKSPQFDDLKQYGYAEMRCFGGDPADYSRSANFAGHYVVESCTCGSGCHFLFMWDAISGKLFYREIPFGAINVGPHSQSSSRAPPVVYRGEEYRLDSALMIVQACFGEDCNCATRYYKWTGSRFDLVSKQAVRMPPDCEKVK